MSERFSDSVLDMTLSAVRRRQQRKRIINGAAACVFLLAALAFFFMPNDRNPPPAEVAVPVPVPIPDPVDVVAEKQPPIVIVFSTKDVKTNVRLLDDTKLSVHLADRAHGIYTTSDGERRLWLPEESVTRPKRRDR